MRSPSGHHRSGGRRPRRPRGDDISDFDSLATPLGEDSDMTVLDHTDPVRGQAATGLVVPASGRVVAVVGLDDVA